MMTNNQVALIIIGDEILRGQVQDSNTMYLAKVLYAVGIKIKRVVVVPDEVEVIAKEVAEASKNFPLVFTAGGVGPTHDDVTYEAVAQGLGLKLQENKQLLQEFKKLYPEEPEIRRLARVPTPCELVPITPPNSKGSAESHSIVKASNVYVLPGSPMYFRPAVDGIVPLLDAGSTLRTACLDVELEEFALLSALDEQARRWAGSVKIGSYPQPGGGRTLLSLESESREQLVRARDELVAALPSNAGLVVRFDEEAAEAVYDGRREHEHLHRAFKVLEQCYDRYKADEVFLSFNGGKDCTVVLHLAATFAKIRKIDPPLCLYVTGDSFPEVDKFVKDASRYYGFELICKEGTIRRSLGHLLDEKPNLKACLLGTRRDDPGAQSLEPFTPTDPDWPNIMRVSPIIDWTYSQVWQFLLKHKVPYCSLYDQGYTSLGAKATTQRNPLLRDPKDPDVYLPAHTLADDSTERHGRCS